MWIQSLRSRGIAAFTTILLGAGTTLLARNLTYQGDIATIDLKTHTLIVKGSRSGEAPEMTFHLNSGSEVYIGGDRIPVGELTKGDRVTVTYDTNGVSRTIIRHAKKS